MKSQEAAIAAPKSRGSERGKTVNITFTVALFDATPERKTGAVGARTARAGGGGGRGGRGCGRIAGRPSPSARGGGGAPRHSTSQMTGKKQTTNGVATLMHSTKPRSRCRTRATNPQKIEFVP